jgi:hypothetical protein
MPSRKKSDLPPSTARTPKLKRDYSARPGLAKGLRLKQRVKTSHDSDAIYIPVFPLVFKDENLTYGKNYDVLMTHYIEARYGAEPILRWEHLGLFNDILYHAEHGEAFYTRALAKRRRTSRKRLKAMLDRLEDARLIKRVRCMDVQGQPIHVIICAPYEGWQMEEFGPELLKRVLKESTRKLRDKVGTHVYPSLRWDLKTMLSALAGEFTAKELQDMSIAIKYCEHVAAVNEEDWTREEFVERVKQHCDEERFEFSDKLFFTALCYNRLNNNG